MKLRIATLLGSTLFAATISAQSVGIGNASFTPGAMLEVRGAGNSSATTALIISNSTPTTMLSVLNNGNINVPTTTSGGMGVLTMNSNRFMHAYGTETFFAGTNAGNFTHSGEGVTAVGYSALAALTSGWYNTAIGANAMGTATPGHRNTALGYNALKPNTQAENVAIGAHAMQANTSGNSNTAIGTYAMSAATHGTENTAIGNTAMGTGVAVAAAQYNTMIGSKAGEDITSAASNTAVGAYALTNLTTGDHNVAIGKGALATGTSFTENVGIGLSALTTATSSRNTAIGFTALTSLSGGQWNTAIGYNAGGSVVSGNRNVFLGYNAGASETGSDKLYIANASGTALIYGDFSSNKTGLGAVLTPQSTLDVEGNLAVGATYSGTTAAPTNGMIVEGNVGIGTSTTSYLLDVAGISRFYTTAGGDNGVYLNPGSMPAGKSGIAVGYNQTYNGTAMTNSGFLQAESQGVAYRNLLLEPVGGNVGIGTTAPATNVNLHVYGIAVTGGTNGNLSVGSSQGTANILGTWINSASTGYAQFTANATYSSSAWSTVNSSYDQWATMQSITTGSTGSWSVFHSVAGATPSWTEYLHLNSSNGNLGIGSATPGYKLDVTGGVRTSGRSVFNGTGTGSAVSAIDVNFTGVGTEYGIEFIPSNSGNGTCYCQFDNSAGTTVGSIQYDGSTTVSYYGTSDRRLKTNITNTKRGLNDLMKIQVRDFNYKTDLNKRVTGFIAQELYEIYPDVVSKPLDESNNYWMVDYGKITPLIIKSVQDQQTIIEKQNAQIEQLILKQQELEKQIFLLKQSTQSSIVR